MHEGGLGKEGGGGCIKKAIQCTCLRPASVETPSPPPIRLSKGSGVSGGSSVCMQSPYAWLHSRVSHERGVFAAIAVCEFQSIHCIVGDSGHCEVHQPEEGAVGGGLHFPGRKTEGRYSLSARGCQQE